MWHKLSDDNDDFKRRKFRRGILVISILAWVISLGIWFLDPYSHEPRKDSLQYHNIAKNLVATGSYSLAEDAPWVPTGHRTPGYPAFLALFYSIAGPNVLVVKFAQTFFAPLCCLLVYTIGIEAFGCRRVALCASAIVATSPPILAYHNHLATEGLYAVLLLAGTVSAYRWNRSDSYSWPIVTGLFMGLLAIVKPEAALISLPISFVIGLNSMSWRVLRQIVIAGLCALAFIGPWIIRNRAVFGEYCLLSGALERTGGFDVGTMRWYRWQVSNGFLHMPDRVMFYPNKDIETTRYYELEAEWRDNGYLISEPETSDAAFWLNNTTLFAKCSVIRLWVLVQPTAWADIVGITEGNSELVESKNVTKLVIKLAMLSHNAILTGTSIVAILLSMLRLNRCAWLLLVPIAYSFAVYGTVHSTVRYFVPLLPLMYCFAANALMVVLRLKQFKINSPICVPHPSDVRS